MNESGLGVIACDVVRGELEKVIAGRDIPFMGMDYALHETPKEMPGKLNEAVREMAAKGCRRLAMGYGLCSNGTAGVTTDAPGGLIMPRCHDCISMLLGSPARYMEVFSKYPGTFFLSDGWFRNSGDPLSTVLERYTPKLGVKRAFKGMQMEIAGYNYLCLINNGVGDLDLLRERAHESCRVFKKKYLELEADLSFFEAMVSGPWKESDFLLIEPGEAVKDEQFYDPITPVLETEAVVEL